MTGNLGPFPQVAPLPPYGFPAGLPPFVAGYTTRLTAYIQDLDSICCGHFSLFDTDDDGTFDDHRDFQPGVGRHTLVLKGGDGTAVATVRQTFPVVGPAQSVDQGEDQGQPTPPPAPQPAPAPKGDPKPSLQLAIKSLKHTARGVTLRTTCSAGAGRRSWSSSVPRRSRERPARAAR